MFLTFKEFLFEQAGVGKKMGHDLYLHRSAEDLLPSDLLMKAKMHLPKGFNYTIVKYNKKDGAFSFIESDDFDEADEPTVGVSIKVNVDGSTKVTNPPKDPLIYHGKWQFVKPDYSGFDIDQSKKRHDHWRKFIGVNNRAVSSRIGRKSYWEREIIPNL